MSSDLSSDLRLECHSLDSCYPRSKIQDFPESFSWKSWDKPKIQDPRFPENFSWMHLQNLGCTQDPRSKIPRKFFLDAGWKSWMHPRSKIQDFQKTFLGCTCRILDAPKILDLGFIPRFPRFPRKVFWKSWILDLGCIQDFQPASKKKILGILDLGSSVAGFEA